MAAAAVSGAAFSLKPLSPTVRSPAVRQAPCTSRADYQAKSRSRLFSVRAVRSSASVSRSPSKARSARGARRVQASPSSDPSPPSETTETGPPVAQSKGNLGSKAEDEDQQGPSTSAASSPAPDVKQDKPKGSRMWTSAYLVLSAMFACLGAGLIGSAERVVPLLAGAATSGSTVLLMRILGAVLLPLAAACYCLSSAVEHNRLASATYQRLNLGLIASSLYVMTAKATLEQALGLGSTPDAIFVLTAVFTMCLITAMFNYLESEEVLTAIPTKLVSGTLDVARVLTAPVPEKAPLPGGVAAAYTGLCLYFGLSAGALVAAPLASLQPFIAATLDPAVALDRFVVQVAGAGLLVLSAACYNLRDAASRGRLTAGTFRTLNFSLAWYSTSLVGVYTRGLSSGTLTGLMYGDLALTAAIGIFGTWAYATFKKP